MERSIETEPDHGTAGMNRPSRSRPTADELRVMPWWFVLLGLLASVVLGWIVLGWLLGEADQAAQADTRAQLRIDAIRTGLTVVAGTGGGVALLLAARRQWINERGQRHEEKVAAQDQAHKDRVQAYAEASADAERLAQETRARAADHDATERRVTELYTKAVDLLGNDSPAVRLGGLYALERLAQDNDKQRPTIVAVACGYLRMRLEGDDPYEQEVRLSAQRLLTRHLNAHDDRTYWPGVRLDLVGAQLIDFDAAGCTLVDADLSGAEFEGRASFADATVSGRFRLAGARFDTATFDGMGGDAEVTLDDAQFDGEVTFKGTDFHGPVSARRTRFTEASFSRATFHAPAAFDRARFDGRTSFRDATFGPLAIEHAEFAGDADFPAARFQDMALFRWSVFHRTAYFDNAVFGGAVNFARAQFHTTASFDGATLQRKPMFDQARASATGAHVWLPGTRTSPLDEEWLVLVDADKATP